jgi:hypothetical protein
LESGLGGLVGSLLLGCLARALSISPAWTVGAAVLVGSSALYMLLPGTGAEPETAATAKVTPG